jgi:hypothetical protein
MFQLANWLIVLSTGFRKIGLILSVRSIRVKRPPTQGETVNLHVDWRASRPEGALFTGWGRVGDEEILTGEGCMAYLTDLCDLEDAGDLRVLFEEIAPGCPLPPPAGDEDKACAST